MIPNLLSAKEFYTFITADPLTVVHFYASWAESCIQLNDILSDLEVEMAGAFKASFVDAEGLSQVSLENNISAVPTIIIFKKGKEVDRIDGFHPAQIREKINKHSMKSPAVATEDLNSKLKRLINSHPLMLFMKGDPDHPRCGFSRQVIDLLKEHEAEFGTFDILEDESVRNGLKTYSNWPTFPQLYLNGELIGGLDVLREELKDSAFVKSLPKKQKPAESDPNAHLKKLINTKRLMLFMKGDRDHPRCGFSKQTIELLESVNADYGTFDILEDESVRQGLKVFSNWPTYPQLYLDGQLIGGLDVIREEFKDPQFKAQLPTKN